MTREDLTTLSKYVGLKIRDLYETTKLSVTKVEKNLGYVRMNEKLKLKKSKVNSKQHSLTSFQILFLNYFLKVSENFPLCVLAMRNKTEGNVHDRKRKVNCLSERWTLQNIETRENIKHIRIKNNTIAFCNWQSVLAVGLRVIHIVYHEKIAFLFLKEMLEISIDKIWPRNTDGSSMYYMYLTKID